MMTRCFLCLLTITAITWMMRTPALAQDCLSDAAQLAESVSGGAAEARSCLEEQYRDGAPVSMGFSSVRGIMEAELFSSPFDSDRNYFMIHADEEQPVCIVYHGRDGRYRGLQSFNVGRGWVRLPFGTRFADEIEALGSHGLAVEAFRGPDCRSPLARRYLPVVGDEKTGAGADFVMIVQTGWGSAQIDVYDDAGMPVANGRCSTLAEESTVRFDKVCEVPIEAWESGRSIALVSRAGNRFASEAVSIAPPTP